VKNLFKTIFSPILGAFEGGEEPFVYQKSHRIILIMLGTLFLMLSLALLGLSILFSKGGALIPSVVFFAVAVTSLVVGTLGSNRAVAKIWGSK